MFTPTFRQNSTLAIVGRGKTREFMPWENPDVDVWAFNDFAMQVPRLTAAFEMHNDWHTADRYGEEYKEWLRTPQPFPILMHQESDIVPSSKKFPRHAINALYNRNIFRGAIEEQNFYTSSTPYALALALWCRYPRIEIYGVDLAGDGEYHKYADCIFFWLGKASALDVEIIFHPSSPILERFTLYGI